MKLFVGATAGALIVAAVLFRCWGIDAADLPRLPVAMTYTDRAGDPLGTILGSTSTHTVSVGLPAVSPWFVQAIVAAEDARFWRHGAADARSMLRAVREYAIYGEPQSGASTIEMQLARFVSPSSSTLRGKFAQMVTAERIEIASSKSSILEAYVNRVPMGGNIYGVEAAARTYFGEPAADLDLAQASLLAAIPNDPSRLAPGGDWTALRARQRYVLQRMTASNDITPSQAARAFAETLGVRQDDSGIADAPHALFYINRAAPATRGRVRTTIDRALQRFVQAQTQDVIAALQAYNVNDAAALVVDNRTGAVRAYVGSPDYFADPSLGRNDGVQALRQPGSALKPFTYELALERGVIRATTMLDDTPAAYALPGGRLYQPADYSGRFSGPVRVRYALANSLNVPAVRVLSGLGVQPLLDRLRDLGFTHLTKPASYYGLGLTLGGGEVSLWELVDAYVTMARYGNALPLQLTTGSAPQPREIGNPSYWQLVTDMLADPHAREHSFGHGSVLDLPFPAAVKTGTSSDFHDTWTVGFTREYTVGVWVGNFDGSPMRGVSGVTGAGPLWNRIMLHLYERNAEPPPFAPPRGFVPVAICANTGRTPSARQRCPVVREWTRPRELAQLRVPAPVRRWHIVFPHDGDRFILTQTTDPLQRREQQLALQTIGASGPVRWSVAGQTLQPDADGVVFWRLRLGAWRIVATTQNGRDEVTIHVDAPGARRPGFTLTEKRPPGS
jgi:penicillin-binding protein 1C